MDSDDGARLRALMVERQLRARGIRNEAVLSAMAHIPRELFVPNQMRSAAYADEALPIEADQTISQPYMVGWMSELLQPEPGKRILEVGTGSGYQAAILAWIGCSVTSIERRAELVEAAGQRLANLGLGDRVTIEVGDGSLGRPDDAPFDGMIVTAAAPSIPAALPDQLVIGGRLVIPVGRRERQDLTLVVRRLHDFVSFDCGPCVFVPLVGRGGFEEEEGKSWLRRIL